MLLTELQCPKYWGLCGGFDENNTFVGGAIAPDVFKVSTFADDRCMRRNVFNHTMKGFFKNTTKTTLFLQKETSALK